MKTNFDKILGAVSLLFGVIFIGLIFVEVSEKLYLVVSILYFIFAIIGLFFRVRRNHICESQEQDTEEINNDVQ